MKKRSLSATEKGMLITIALLGIFVALRWGYIRQRATDGMNYLKPDSTAIQRFNDSTIQQFND
ncbi:MAG: hypothetical protein LBU92_03565 [Prevotellaceae bacterium]|jgi:hypothetical protein|nr:hypothetical protein [Prevotellaceae bacterium]